MLHDTVEDTNTTHEELVQEFGEDVANVVKEVCPSFKPTSLIIFPLCLLNFHHDAFFFNIYALYAGDRRQIVA